MALLRIRKPDGEIVEIASLPGQGLPMIDTHASYLVHKVTAWDADTLMLTLDSNASTLAVGDIISIDGGNNYPYCATIKSIIGNTITVDKMIKDHQGRVLDPTTEDHYLFVDGKPNTGNNVLGEGQIAGGIGNHAIAKAATAFGRDCVASGGYAMAAGRKCKAANYSIAMGRECQATGFNSAALGYQAKASGIYGTALGYRTEASGMYALAAGANNKASGTGSVALGDTTESQGTYSFSLGHQATANGYAAVAIGNPYPNGADPDKTLIQATADLAMAYGQGCRATAGLATARGLLTKATGSMSTALGQETEAKGAQSFAGGMGCEARGNRAFAYGKGLITSSSIAEQTAFGRFNIYRNDALFIVGNGTSDNRSNAFVVKEDGSAEVQTQGQTANAVATKGYVDEIVGDIETALDSIITIQESLIATGGIAEEASF